MAATLLHTSFYVKPRTGALQTGRLGRIDGLQWSSGGKISRAATLLLMIAGLCMAQEGTRVYIARCQQCHDQNSDGHAPLREALATKPWAAILAALETGAMRAQGAQLTPEERLAVAVTWGGPDQPFLWP